MVTFHHRESGKAYHSDYRCQFRLVDESSKVKPLDVRVYLVGGNVTEVGIQVPAILAFLELRHGQEHCQLHSQFCLSEGTAITATGVVNAIAIR